MVFKKFNEKRLGKRERDFIRYSGIEVKELPKKLSKQGFIGYRVKTIKGKWVKKPTILLKKGIRKPKLEKTFWHEVGHLQYERNKPTKTERKRMSKEVKKTVTYTELKKGGYAINKIAEEFVVEIFAEDRAGKRFTPKQIRIIKRRYPTLTKQFLKLKKHKKR